MGDLDGIDAEPPTGDRRPSAARRSTRRTESALWLVAFGALVTAVSASVLPATVARDTQIDATGPSLLAAGPGYWILVGVGVLALATFDAYRGRPGAWAGVVALGAACTATAAIASVALPPAGEPLGLTRGTTAATVPTRPGPAVFTLAVAGVAVAAGGLLLRTPRRRGERGG